MSVCAYCIFKELTHAKKCDENFYNFFLYYRCIFRFFFKYEDDVNQWNMIARMMEPKTKQKNLKLNVNMKINFENAVVCVCLWMHVLHDRNVARSNYYWEHKRRAATCTDDVRMNDDGKLAFFFFLFFGFYVILCVHFALHNRVCGVYRAYTDM